MAELRWRKFPKDKNELIIDEPYLIIVKYPWKRLEMCYWEIFDFDGKPYFSNGTRGYEYDEVLHFIPLNEIPLPKGIRIA